MDQEVGTAGTASGSTGAAAAAAVDPVRAAAAQLAPGLTRRRSSGGEGAGSGTSAPPPPPPLQRSVSYRPPRGGGAAADSALSAVGKALFNRRFRRRIVVQPAGRQQNVDSEPASLGFGAIQSRRHQENHLMADADGGNDQYGGNGNDGGDGAVGSRGGPAAASGSGSAGGVRLRSYRSFPTVVLAAAAEAYLHALSRHGRRRRDPPPSPSPEPKLSYTKSDAATSLARADTAQSAAPPEAAAGPSSGPSASFGGVNAVAVVGRGPPGRVAAAAAAPRGQQSDGGAVQEGSSSPPQGPATPTGADASLAASTAAESVDADCPDGAAAAPVAAEPPLPPSSAPSSTPQLGGTLNPSRPAAPAAQQNDSQASGITAVRLPVAATFQRPGQHRASGSGCHCGSDEDGGGCSGGGGGPGSECGSSAALDDDFFAVGSGSSCSSGMVSSKTSYLRIGSGSSGGSSSSARCSLVRSAVSGISCDDDDEGNTNAKTAKAATSVEDGSSFAVHSSSSSRQVRSPPKLVVLQPRDPPAPRPPPGVRFFMDGRGPSYKQPLPYRMLAQVTLGAYVGWPYVLLMLLITAICGSRTALLALAVLAGTLLLPAPPKQWDALLDSSLFRLWRDYFNFSMLYEEMLDLTRPYMFVMSPHGAFPLSQILGASLGGLLWPNFPTHTLAASCLFYVPLWRHIKSWLGAAPATRANARRLLANHGSVGVLPGGIAEMFAQAEAGGGNTERVKLLGRRGFVRLAVETGVPIVPCYHFGNSQILSFGPPVLQPLSRKLRVALGTIVGVWGLPVPRPQPLFMCIGRPIHVPYADPRDPDFDARVDETLERVVAEFKRLYEQYGKLYGWQERPLELC